MGEIICALVRGFMRIYGGCSIRTVVVTKVVGVQKERECTTRVRQWALTPVQPFMG
jgi:hypothetical protein